MAAIKASRSLTKCLLNGHSMADRKSAERPPNMKENR